MGNLSPAAAVKPLVKLSGGEEPVCLLQRVAALALKEQAHPGGYLRQGDVQEERGSAAAKLGEERGAEQMGGGGERGGNRCMYISDQK